MVKLHKSSLPDWSMAMYVTVVIPKANSSPDFASDVKLHFNELSRQSGSSQYIGTASFSKAKSERSRGQSTIVGLSRSEN